MKRTLLVSLLSLSLFGCGLHSNDPRPPHFKAMVKTVDNKVCVMVQPEDDETISTLSINEIGNDNNRLSKYDLNKKITSSDCVPTFGYKFEAGKIYTFDIYLASENKMKNHINPAVRFYGASFTLQDKNGKLEATTPY